MLECAAMDVSDLIDPLNDEQREAVTAPLGRALVLAGAGSGKTRVLTHRIAWLIRVENASPFGILAVTFTNKAAAEMRGRIEQLIETGTGGMWVGTFHGLAHRLLRQHWQEANLPQAFQILDSDDQLRMIKRVLRALEMDEGRWPPVRCRGSSTPARTKASARSMWMPDSARTKRRWCGSIRPTRTLVSAPGK